jgi:hypothetical protein
MPRVRIHRFGMSVDGYGAGVNQSLDDPLGVGGGVATVQAYLRARLIDARSMCRRLLPRTSFCHGPEHN